ncbi:MAG: hypothetical protein KBC67_01445 [Candidatus Pacebacteria bacterium]|nr:hypothetical protein [Candidatus Paceibacterota bacterium]
MKKINIILITAMVICAQHIYAQVQLVSADSSVRSSVYAGMFSSTMYQLDTSVVNNSGDFRVGFKSTWSLSNKVAVTGLYAAGFVDGSPYNIYSFRASYMPTSKLLIVGGLTPALATELRAEPIAPYGHFEAWSRARIPGTAPGIKAKYTIGKVRVGAGIASRENEAELHGSIEYGNATLVAYSRDGEVAAAMLYSDSRLFNLISYDLQKVLGGVTMISFKLDSAKVASYAAYVSYGYKPSDGSLPKFEVGFLKFHRLKLSNTSKVGGMFGIGYAKEINSITGYVFLHL